MSATSRLHKAEAPLTKGILIITCSTSRANLMASGEKPSDPSGDLIENKLKEHGHNVYGRELVSDNQKDLQSIISNAIRNPEIDTIIITGGTGISQDDITIEVAEKFFDKWLLGFGEFFRRISFDNIGSAALLSRATAGIASKKPIFCIPGSPDAVTRALDSLILPELLHILKHAQGR